MAQVRVNVGGRAYPLACKDGEEELLEKLAKHVNSKAEQLSSQLGHLPEVRLLLMAAIMIADDYVELAAAGDPLASKTPAPTAVEPDTESENRAAAAIAAATEKVERLTALLEKSLAAS
ncbi:MAG: cell division protein ZapA [Pacificimonas sp.]